MYAIHRGSCPFKPLNATQSPHKSRRLSYAWAPMTTVLSMHNFLWGMIRVAKVAVKSLSFKTTKGKRAQEPKHIGRDAQSARRNPTPSAKQWRQMWCGFDEWYSLVTVPPPSLPSVILGFTKRLTPWTNAMRAHLFFFCLFFLCTCGKVCVSLSVSCPFVCSLARRLMATLKAKTIAFIFSAVQT